METLKKLVVEPTLLKLLVLLSVWLVIFVLSVLLRRSIANYLHGSELRYRARKLTSFAAYLLALGAAALVFSDRLGAVSISLGVAGAGIAFALQEVVVSVAGWVAIAFGRFYGTGDRVQLGGIKGDVIDIGLLRTTLMEIGQWVDADLYNGRIVRVANSFVFREPVFNYSADFPFLWDEIGVPVRYGSDWEEARQLLLRVAHEVCADYALASKEAWQGVVQRYRIEDANIEPMVTLAATDNWIQFTLRYIVDFRQRRSVRSRLFTRVLEEVDKSGNLVRLASATFEVTNLPRFELDMEGRKGLVEPRFVP